MTIIPDNITQGLHGISSIIHQHNIFIFGGEHSSISSQPRNTVHILNTITDKIALSNDRLNYSVSYAASIMVNGVIYAFGGYNTSSFPGREYERRGTNNWQYYAVLTVEPSISASQYPSFTPSTSPSDHESFSNQTTISPDDTESETDVLIIILIIVLGIVYIVCICICETFGYKTKHNKEMDLVKRISNHDCIENKVIKVEINQNNMSISSIKDKTTGKRLGDIKTNSEMAKDGIRLWLQSFSFPRYFDNFVLAGYDSIEFIKQIDNMSELKEIDICSESDCIEILEEIDKLKMNDNGCINRETIAVDCTAISHNVLETEGETN